MEESNEEASPNVQTCTTGRRHNWIRQGMREKGIFECLSNQLPFQAFPIAKILSDFHLPVLWCPAVLRSSDRVRRSDKGEENQTTPFRTQNQNLQKKPEQNSSTSRTLVSKLGIGLGTLVRTLHTRTMYTVKAQNRDRFHPHFFQAFVGAKEEETWICPGPLFSHFPNSDLEPFLSVCCAA